MGTPTRHIGSNRLRFRQKPGVPALAQRLPPRHTPRSRHHVLARCTKLGLVSWLTLPGVLISPLLPFLVLLLRTSVRTTRVACGSGQRSVVHVVAACLAACVWVIGLGGLILLVPRRMLAASVERGGPRSLQ